MVKVASANFYVGNTQPQKDAKFLRSFDFDVAGVQEGHSGNIEAIRAAIGDTHNVRFGDTFEGKDVPVVFPKKLNVKSFKSRRVSKRAEVKNIGMPRAASILRFKKDGQTYCFINTHLNAAVQNRETDKPLSRQIPRVFEYTRSIVALELIIRRAKKRGEHVILVGDLNYRSVPGGNDWFYSPHKMFKRVGMTYRDERLDYVAWTGRLKLETYRLVRQTQHGADHPWIIASFSVKKPLDTADLP